MSLSQSRSPPDHEHLGLVPQKILHGVSRSTFLRVSILVDQKK